MHIRSVGDFSKKTGDFPSLSIVDLKVIALTYELHMKHGGEIKDFDKEAVSDEILVRAQ